MRFHLNPSPAQAEQLLEYCSHARFVWNLAVDQDSNWRKGRAHAPSFAVQCRQLAEARKEFDWLGAGSSVVQQQALKDYDQAKRAFFSQPAKGKPTFRKRGLNEGFRITDTGPSNVRRLSRKIGEVRIPKIGWVRFRWSRNVGEFKSFRVTLDRSGRWHVAFAIMPPPVEAPGNGLAVGVDRGVKVSAALSNGELLNVRGLSATEARRLLLLQRKLSRCARGSNRRGKVKLAIAKLKAREVDRRKDWVEKLSTRLATEFDVVGIEDLKVAQMSKAAKGKNVRQKAGLNRGILANGWTLLADRLEQKAPGRVYRVPAAYTSQRCSACGFVDKDSRKSQAKFECTTCGFVCNADTNAARNVKHSAAGLAVAAQAVSMGELARLVCEPPFGAVA